MVIPDAPAPTCKPCAVPPILAVNNGAGLDSGYCRTKVLIIWPDQKLLEEGDRMILDCDPKGRRHCVGIFRKQIKFNSLDYPEAPEILPLGWLSAVTTPKNAWLYHLEV
jgi:hypothetical protein